MNKRYLKSILHYDPITGDLQNRGKQKNNTTGFKGVSKVRDKFLAKMVIEGEPKHLGLFSDPELAHKAYVNAARKYFGGFHKE